MERTETTNGKGKQKEAKKQSQIDGLRKAGKAQIQDAVGCFAPSYQSQLLSEALADVKPVTDAAGQLKEMEQPVREIVNKLNAKSKAVIACLAEVAGVDGMSGVEWGNEVLYEDLRKAEHIEAALQELADDEDVKLLAEVYGLARQINSFEGPFAQNARQPVPQPQRDDESDQAGESEPPKLEAAETATPDDDDDGPSTGAIVEEGIKNWLLSLDRTAKLACVLTMSWSIGDHGTDKMIFSVLDQFRAEILKTGENLDPSNRLTDMYLAGVISECAVWEKNM